MNNKYGNLLKDLLLFALSVFIPKTISFFFVPLYTNNLSAVEYGTVDMIATMVNLCIPFLTLNISDAVLRFTIENKTDRMPFLIAFRIVVYGAGVVVSLVALNLTTGLFAIFPIYQVFFAINYTLTALYGINMAYLRATNRVVLLAAVSIINTLVIVLLNIFTLLVMKMGIWGYLFSNTAALFLVNVIVFYKIGIVSLLKEIKRNDKMLQDKMVSYSKPLVAGNIAWWVTSASDRFFVTYICGIRNNGIYSIAYKIPTVLQMLQSIFSQAWLLSVYREYNKPDGKIFVSRIYDLYNSAICISCGILILFDIPIASFLYAKEFFKAWKYVPALLISVVFIANAGFFESLITLFKKSKAVAFTAFAGAAVNIILNFVLIHLYGVQGAAIATASGYFIMCVLRVVVAQKEFPFYINWIKSGLLFILLLIEAIIMVNMQNYFICTIIVVIMIAFDRKTIVSLVCQVKDKYAICKKKGKK